MIFGQRRGNQKSIDIIGRKEGQIEDDLFLVNREGSQIKKKNRRAKNKFDPIHLKSRLHRVS